MKSLFVNLITITIFITNSYQTPQIFRDIETCELPVQEKKQIKFYTVPAELNAQNGDIRVKVSLCKKENYVPENSPILSTISVYNKNSGFSVNDTSVPKPYEATNDKEGVLIILQNEIKCNEQENYYVAIKIGKTNSKKPRLNMESDCSLEIEVASPDYNPPCTSHIDGKWFIDLNPLRNHPITILNKEGDKYMISLCGPIRQCRQEAGCKITGNATTIIGSNKKLNVKFQFNSVTVSSSTSTPKKTMTVTIKCDWKVPYFSNPKLLNEGTNHKFEVYSSFGCVKKPTSCILTNQHLGFDLNGLTTNSGSNVKGLKLSICRDLNVNWRGNERNWLKSQVCEINGMNYVNRGSIPSFSVVDNGVTALFADGDKCNENETYSTTVDLKCSTINSGPDFVSQQGCSTKLSWKTPKACPKYQIIKKNCELSSVFGKLNVTELYKSTDYTAQIARDQRLIYNVCGNIKTNCSTSSDVSVCLLDRNERKVVGWNEPTLSFVDGEIKLEYKGEKCGNFNKPYTFTLNLVCSFKEKIEEVDPVVTKVNDCTFVAKMATRTACLKPWIMEKCVVEGDNFKYDLSFLMRKTENYRVRDEGDSNISYFLNLCAPVIPEKGSLFYSGFMVYMVNASEPSIIDKFIEIGSVANPVLQNGDLVIEAKMGKQCFSPNGLTSYSSKISFECSEVEELPRVENHGCQIDFKWRTKHACPIMKKGGTCTLKAGDRSMQVPGDPIEMKIDEENTYHFSLCLDHYKWCRMGRCVIKKLFKNGRMQDETLYSQYNLTDSNVLKTVNMMIECDPSKALGYTKDYRGRDHLNVLVKTRMACRNAGKTIRNTLNAAPEKNKTMSYEVSNDSKPKNTTISSDKKLDEPEIVITTDELLKSNETSLIQKETLENQPKSTTIVEKIKTIEPEHRLCQILDVQGNKIDLYTLDGVETRKGNDIYIFNFDGTSSKCKGWICKNGRDILGFIEKCPEVIYRNGSTVLKYSTGEQCSVVEVSLGCRNDGVLTNFSEEDCKVAVSYLSPKICYLVSSSNSHIWVIVILVVLFVFLIVSFVLFVLYRKDYFKKCSYDSVSEADVLVVHSKML